MAGNKILQAPRDNADATAGLAPATSTPVAGAAMVGAALLLWGLGGNAAVAGVQAWQTEWPRTDFTRHGVDLAEITEGYPLRIMMQHEIVNDNVGGLPVTVTYCPLCNSAVVFDRQVAGQVLDFGTTGKLRHSDLVMYGRQGESWRQQFTGEAIVGAMTFAFHAFRPGSAAPQGRQMTVPHSRPAAAAERRPVHAMRVSSFADRANNRSRSCN